ncbi:hypothetical protein K501DRAFT_334875 [Backusella circina FSU 941]|nr:hypothetical protein K501DRAFT_334875 [Backusella circina FSU 941]
MNQTAPPSLPPGWIALWDETSQRYYYLEQATGLTQWDVPTADSKHTENTNRGEANSYNTNFSSQGSGYPSYQQQQQQPGAVSTSYPTQSTAEGDQQDRGLGKIMHGFSGGAITGSLLGFAAGKLMGNHNKHNSGNNHGYAPPPPQYGGGYGGGYNYGAPPGNYGPPGYSNPPAPYAPHGQHGHHGHHGNHGHHGHHGQGW